MAPLNSFLKSENSDINNKECKLKGKMCEVMSVRLHLMYFNSKYNKRKIKGSQKKLSLFFFKKKLNIQKHIGEFQIDV